MTTNSVQKKSMLSKHKIDDCIDYIVISTIKTRVTTMNFCTNWHLLFRAAPYFFAAATTCTSLREAHAENVPSDAYCILSRSPVLLASSINDPSLCEIDQDGNGLDDLVERELANCFVPALKFDLEERYKWDNGFIPCPKNEDDTTCKSHKDWATSSNFDDTQIKEPNVLFSAMRISPEEININFIHLWRWDGGFVAHKKGFGFAGCNNAHEGDAQPLDVVVKVVRTNNYWVAYPISLRNPFIANQSSGQVTLNGPQETRMELLKTHPVVYPSAGKHHFYAQGGRYRYDTNSKVNIADIVDIGIDIEFDFDMFTDNECADRALGEGALIIPGQDKESPLGWLSLRQLPQKDAAQTPLSSANVCRFFHDQSFTPLDDFFQLPDLGNIGYVGENLYDHFYDEANSAPIDAQPSLFVDADGDGKHESYVVTNDQGSISVEMPSDKCPWTNVGPYAIYSNADEDADNDEDGDLLYGDCDVEPRFFNPYTPYSANAYHAVSSSSFTTHHWSSFTTQRTDLRWGYSDPEHDGLITGEDLCPSVNGGGEAINPNADANRYGEGLLEELTSSYLPSHHLGILRRGDVCDPYPGTNVSWMTKDPDSLSSPGAVPICMGTHNRQIGADSMSIHNSVTVGRSANDPSRDETKQPTRKYQVQTYRCSCSNVDGPDSSNNTAVNTACLGDTESRCSAKAMNFMNIDTPIGIGWRPVERPDCVHDIDGYCAPEVKTLLARSKTDWNVDWSWKNEWQASLGVNNTHFDPADIAEIPGSSNPAENPHSEAFYRSRYRYALRSLVLDATGTDFSTPPGLAFPGKNEPEEFFPQLLDVKSTESRWLRASFAAPQRLVSSHGTMYVGGPLCYDFGGRPARYLDVLWRPDPPPDFQDRLHGIPYEDISLIAHFGDRFGEQAILSTHALGYRRIALANEDTSDWAAEGQGLGVPQLSRTLRSSSPTAPPPLNATALGPQMLWIEQEPARARWALFTATEQTADTTSYNTQAEGVLSPGLSATARMVPDVNGEGAALIDPMSRGLLYFDPVLKSFIQAAETPAELSRSGAAMILTGSSLLIAGGEERTTLTGELVQMDAVTGKILGRVSGLPARRDARLYRSQDGRSLLMMGGHDQAGAQHDDIWAISFSPGADTTVRRVKVDSGNPSPSATTALMGNPESSLFAASVNTASGTLLDLHTATERGWSLTDARGVIEDSDCALTDARGGMLCSLPSSSWWSKPGTVGCQWATEAGVCKGSVGQNAWAASLGIATSFDLDTLGVWTLNNKQISRWDATASNQPTLTATLTLPQNAQQIVAGDSEALLLSSQGVRVVRKQGASLSLSVITVLCGRPLKASYVGSGLYVIRTTQGMSVVSTLDGGAPKTLSSVTPLATGVHTGVLSPLPIDALGATLCAALDATISPLLLPSLERSAHIDAQQASKVILTSGLSAFVLDVSHPQSPTLTGVTSLPAPATALRLAPTEDRAYLAVSLLLLPPAYPTLDLRNGIQVASPHNAAGWLSVREAGPLVARRNGSGVIEVAWRLP